MIFCYGQEDISMPRRRTKKIQEVAISEFKAKCLSLLEEVNKSKSPLRVTRRGEPIADVVPPPAGPEEPEWIGSMVDSLEIIGDIVSPVIDTREIEALRR
jgi:prevent-host-death family protein